MPDLTRLSPLKLTKSFRTVYRRGRWVHGPLLSVGALANGQALVRVGLRTKKGLKGAVVRNRLKRQLRAILAVQGKALRPGVDLVIVLHPPRVPIATEALTKDFRDLCQRAKILRSASS